MRNYKAVLSYDGRGYAGFQRQPKKESIQGAVEKALSFLFQQEIKIHGAGRTDARVSARGQVISFFLPSGIDDLKRARYVLNRLLPVDIVCLELTEVPLSFDARKSALGKEYVYRLSYGERDPLSPYVAPLSVPSFDPGLFQKAMAFYKGKHDFRDFTTKSEDKKAFCREIYGISVKEIGEEAVEVRFIGDGFMTYQVRLMVGVAIKAATGKFSLAEVSSFLDPLKRRILSFKAPAEGLLLERVFYGEKDLSEAIGALS